MFLTRKKHLSWKRLSIGLVSVIVFIIAGFAGFDVFTQPFFRGIDYESWHFISAASKWWYFAIFSGIVFIVTRFIWKKKDIASASSNSFIALLCAEGVSEILKICVGRMRPVVFDALGQVGFNSFSLSDVWHSFPSSHTAAAFAMLVSIGLAKHNLKPFTWMLAIVIGTSQVVTGTNFPSDVLVGAFIGMFFADLIFAFRHKK